MYVYILSFFLILLVLIAFFPPKSQLGCPFLGCRGGLTLRGPLVLLSPSRGRGPALCSDSSLLCLPMAPSINLFCVKVRLCFWLSADPNKPQAFPGCSVENALEGVGREVQPICLSAAVVWEQRGPWSHLRKWGAGGGVQ